METTLLQHNQPVSGQHRPFDPFPLCRLSGGGGHFSPARPSAGDSAQGLEGGQGHHQKDKVGPGLGRQAQGETPLSCFTKARYRVTARGRGKDAGVVAGLAARARAAAEGMAARLVAAGESGVRWWSVSRGRRALHLAVMRWLARPQEAAKVDERGAKCGWRGRGFARRSAAGEPEARAQAAMGCGLAVCPSCADLRVRERARRDSRRLASILLSPAVRRLAARPDGKYRDAGHGWFTIPDDWAEAITAQVWRLCEVDQVAAESWLSILRDGLLVSAEKALRCGWSLPSRHRPTVLFFLHLFRDKNVLKLQPHVHFFVLPVLYHVRDHRLLELPKMFPFIPKNRLDEARKTWKIEVYKLLCKLGISVNYDGPIVLRIKPFSWWKKSEGELQNSLFRLCWYNDRSHFYDLEKSILSFTEHKGGWGHTFWFRAKVEEGVGILKLDDTDYRFRNYFRATIVPGGRRRMRGLVHASALRKFEKQLNLEPIPLEGKTMLDEIKTQKEQDMRPVEIREVWDHEKQKWRREARFVSEEGEPESDWLPCKSLPDLPPPDELLAPEIWDMLVRRASEVWSSPAIPPDQLPPPRRRGGKGVG